MVAPRPAGRAGDVALTVLIVLFALGGAAWAWLLVWFQLFGEVADAADHRAAATTLAVTGVVVLLLGLLALAVRCSRWVLLVAAVVAAGLLLGVAAELSHARSLAEPGSSYAVAHERVGA